MVNDGSPDESLDIARELVALDDRVVVVDLSRNFGHHKAIMAGLSQARGELIFLIDCDLEEDPENLPMFYDALRACPKCDVVYGCQKKRKGTFFHALRGYLFYKILNMLSEVEFDGEMVFSRLMTRRYVQSLLLYKESTFFIVGIWKHVGFVQNKIEIVTRHRGESTYNLCKLVVMAVDAVTSFSQKPLELIFYLGTSILIGSFVYILYVLSQYLFFDTILSGWTSLIISIWILGGLSIFSLGVIGVYLSKVLSEAKHRPFVVVKETIQRNINPLNSCENDNEKASVR